MTIARMLLIVGVAILASQKGSAQELSKRDQLKVAVQEICPVSGERLGAHGRPVKAKIGQEEVFLCRKECLQGKVDSQHWATIHANFAKAQRICPIMKKELPQNPKWTIVEGQIIYVCCPPCTKTIVADPKTHLRALDELYLASLKAKPALR